MAWEFFEEQFWQRYSQNMEIAHDQEEINHIKEMLLDCFPGIEELEIAGVLEHCCSRLKEPRDCKKILKCIERRLMS